MITGRCDHCDWRALAGSHPKMVQLYQNHLRADHPRAWLRG
ncbi:hypothetical protein ACFO0N_09125 [Halobium salinum]|uniref:Uncharacterized protein n=1 Tax=Halobium salinum TaxID=1364940 RepID=A0ABD5PBK0_9EURY|nr:hypothetical protein [Halobium salinum]